MFYYSLSNIILSRKERFGVRDIAKIFNYYYITDYDIHLNFEIYDMLDELCENGQVEKYSTNYEVCVRWRY